MAAATSAAVSASALRASTAEPAPDSAAPSAPAPARGGDEIRQLRQKRGAIRLVQSILAHRAEQIEPIRGQRGDDQRGTADVVRSVGMRDDLQAARRASRPCAWPCQE